MERYIDAEKVHDAIEAIQTSLGSNDDKIWRKNKLRYSGLAMARGVINDTPTADVVPKSEVDALIKENARWLFEYANYRAEVNSIIEKAKVEVAREIFKEIESMLIRYTLEDGYGEYISTGLADEFAELKKKYTEDQSDG